MRVIAIVNQKGGCGKTTTSINLAGCLANEDRRVLVVDLDPQGHSTLGLNVLSENLEKNLYDVFLDEGRGTSSLSDILVPISPNLDLAPSSVILSAAEQKLAGAPGRQNRLLEAIEKLDRTYDYIIIDCPPNVGILTFNALRACDEAIIPLDPSHFALHGVKKLLATIGLLREKTGHRVRIRILLTLFDGRTRYARAFLDELRATFGSELFDTVVHQNVRLREAAAQGRPIAEYDQRSIGYVDYTALTLEIIREELDVLSPIPSEPLRILDPSPRILEEEVVFTLSAPEARTVQIAGDFNNWTPDQDVSSRVDTKGCWTKIIRLQPGVYQYRFIVDGRWIEDPRNPRTVQSPYGGINSVLVLN